MCSVSKNFGRSPAASSMRSLGGLPGVLSGGVVHFRRFACAFRSLSRSSAVTESMSP